MVRRGWGHGCLMGMSESDFRFWASEQLEWDREEAEAAKRAAGSTK